jgi:hypothetical protein
MKRSIFWWLKLGYKMGWVSDVVCSTHDPIPMTEQEELEWEQGYDPCAHVMRVWIS